MNRNNDPFEKKTTRLLEEGHPRLGERVGLLVPEDQITVLQRSLTHLERFGIAAVFC